MAAKRWEDLVKLIPQMGEKELSNALRVEAAGKRRRDLILRMHRRFTKLRQAREFNELTAQRVVQRKKTVRRHKAKVAKPEEVADASKRGV